LNNKFVSKFFKTLLQEKGIFEALCFINAKSEHRFTALYAFDGPSLKNICLVDKKDASVRQMEAIEVSNSYCLYVRDSGQQFVVPDSMADERVQGHPKQAVIQSYCGMPLIGSDSSMLGSLCHFDFLPVSYTDDEVSLLELISPALASWLENIFLQNGHYDTVPER